ncbi:MAG: hypothetical protein II868_03410, partial [Butyrivibrio sp.]|nr:hypothetical protein [Butyrivibrio sp.]
VSAAEWRGTRLTGYAPLYLPMIVQITIQASPESFGTVTGGGDGISPGENVTVTAQANAGYYFTGWYEDNILVSDAASYTFRADRDRHLIASFSDNPEAASPNQGGDQNANAGASAQGGDQNANAGTSAQGGDQNANAGTGAQGGDQNANAGASAQGGDQNANAQGGNQNANAGASAQGGDQNTNAQGGNQNANAGTGAQGGSNAAAQNTGGAATTPGTTPGTTPAATPGQGQVVPYVPANSNDMPTTGVGDMYRVPVTIVLLLFGLIAVLISIPVGKRKRR